MREINYIGIDRNVWAMSVDFEGNVLVSCNGEQRKYKIDEPVNKVVHDTEYVYIYVNHEVNHFYQFKFEQDSFLVGDIFDKFDEHVCEFASHVFGEE